MIQIRVAGVRVALARITIATHGCDPVSGLLAGSREE